MVWPVGAACIGGTASAGATALGLQLDKSNLDLTREIFLMQMRQAKRLFTAQWAEASYRHGEQIYQAAKQHSEAQAMAKASYFQAEKIASQSFKLARDQDSRAYEMSWRTEARESLRDELMNQFNRFNIIMLCDTVCLGCVYALIIEGAPPLGTSQLLLRLYLCCIGGSIALFSISLWLAVTVVRRLHEHTASVLERKLFAQNKDLQKIWHEQLESNHPTGPYVMNLVNAGYQDWVREYIHPLGNPSVQMLSIGVVGMFFCAGFLTHTRYMIEYDAPEAVYAFWSFVGITSLFVLYMKYREDTRERTKQGVYDNSWQDCPNSQGPFAKISKAARELFSNTAVRLGSFERTKDYGERERMEREYAVQTKILDNFATSLQKESEIRAKTRNDVLQILTTAAEELDALPEDLISVLNKIICEVNEADNQTAKFVQVRAKSRSNVKEEESWNDGQRSEGPGLSSATPIRALMKSKPIDAQRTPVLLGSVRMKLGEIALTTLLRIRNLSDEPLRLTNGIHLSQGRYLKDLEVMVTPPGGEGGASSKVCHHLYPMMEIPPRTEVVMAARSGGSNWFPTSGIEGELVFVNKDESWLFRVQFQNQLNRNNRHCDVQASQMKEQESGDVEPVHWQISKDILDYKSNNEVLIFIDKRQGGRAIQTAMDMRQLSLKTGDLLEYHSFGLWVQWQNRSVTLTPTDLVCAPDPHSKEEIRIPTKDITRVRLAGQDLEQENVFDVYSNDRKPLRLAAASAADRDDWIEKILLASGRVVKVLRSGGGDDGNLKSDNFKGNDIDSSVKTDSLAASLSQSQTELLPELHDMSGFRDDTNSSDLPPVREIGSQCAELPAGSDDVSVAGSIDMPPVQDVDRLPVKDIESLSLSDDASVAERSSKPQPARDIEPFLQLVKDIESLPV